MAPAMASIGKEGKGSAIGTAQSDSRWYKTLRSELQSRTAFLGVGEMMHRAYAIRPETSSCIASSLGLARNRSLCACAKAIVGGELH